MDRPLNKSEAMSIILVDQARRSSVPRYEPMVDHQREAERLGMAEMGVDFACLPGERSEATDATGSHVVRIRTQVGPSRDPAHFLSMNE